MVKTISVSVMTQPRNEILVLIIHVTTAGIFLSFQPHENPAIVSHRVILLIGLHHHRGLLKYRAATSGSICI